MKIHFHEPPPEKRIGGLDAATRGLQSALEAEGHTVVVNPPLEDTLPDAAHFHGLWQPSYSGRARRYFEQNVPVIVSPHGMLEPWAWRHKRWKKLPYWHLVESKWIRKATCVLATAPAEARRLASFLPNTRIETLPLGLTGDATPDYEAARARLGWNPEEKVLLFLSRIHEKKGLDLLLDALTRVPLPFPCKLVIVGPDDQPSYAARCRAFAEKHAIRLPTIEWVGPVWGPERWQYLQGADLFCLPTYSENFGLVVLEASQVGTPTLTTSETPWADIISAHGGFISRPAVESIADQLRAFFAAPRFTPPQRQALSAWSRETYSWVSLAPRYTRIYQGYGAGEQALVKTFTN